MALLYLPVLLMDGLLETYEASLSAWALTKADPIIILLEEEPPPRATMAA
jgi:hypothetical protein